MQLGRLGRLWRHAAVQALVTAHVIFALLVGVRSAGGLEWLEMLTYDFLVRVTAGEPTAAPRVALIGATEDDLNRFGWPLSDAVLAEALDKLAALGPSAVGIDLYRDLPRQPGQEQFDAALTRHQNVFAVFKFAEGGKTGIPPPAVLRGTERAGFADTMADPGGIVRRGLLFLDDGETAATSLPLVLVLTHLQGLGMGLAPDPDEPSHMRLGSVTIPPLDPDDGGYVDTDARGYQFLLDYRGGPDAFPRHGLAALIDGTLPADAIEGRIVLLGVSAESVKDYFYTPFSRGVGQAQSIYGITLHAHIAAQLLRHAIDGLPAMQVLPTWGEVLVLWAWCMIGGAVGAAVRATVPLTAILFAGVAVTAITGVAAFHGAVWLPIAPAIIGFAASAGLVTSLMTGEERRQREQLMQIFARNVSPAIAETMWKERETFMEGGRPRPQKLVATVLFTDLRGFTSVSEHMDPQQLMEWLNGYMDTMAGIVVSHEGVIDKYIGDSIMAVFGIPLPRPDTDAHRADAVHAVECALAFEVALGRLNQRWKADGQPTIAMRVGIYTGTLVAGALGSAERLNYTVIGDTVNTASRLESYDKEVAKDRDCRILIGEATRDLLGDRYRYSEVGAVALKGKADTVRAFLVEGRRETVA